MARALGLRGYCPGLKNDRLFAMSTIFNSLTLILGLQTRRVWLKHPENQVPDAKSKTALVLIYERIEGFSIKLGRGVDSRFYGSSLHCDDPESRSRQNPVGRFDSSTMPPCHMSTSRTVSLRRGTWQLRRGGEPTLCRTCSPQVTKTSKTCQTLEWSACSLSGLAQLETR